MLPSTLLSPLLICLFSLSYKSRPATSVLPIRSHAPLFTPEIKHTIQITRDMTERGQRTVNQYLFFLKKISPPPHFSWLTECVKLFEDILALPLSPSLNLSLVFKYSFKFILKNVDTFYFTTLVVVHMALWNWRWTVLVGNHMYVSPPPLLLPPFLSPFSSSLPLPQLSPFFLLLSPPPKFRILTW